MPIPLASPLGCVDVWPSVSSHLDLHPWRFRAWASGIRMLRSLTRIISDSLHLTDNAAIYEISRQLADLFPDSYILETEDYDFDLMGYAESGRCHLYPVENTHAQFGTAWYPKQREVKRTGRSVLYEVLWRGHRLYCLEITYGSCDNLRSFVIAPDIETARAFFGAVGAWHTASSEDIAVFTGGKWQRSTELRKQIAGTTFDDLVLTGNLRDELIADFEGFFSAKELYARMGVTWKRGLLLLGPPGNGKTHCIKAMVQRIGKPCLYVRSFKPSGRSETVHGCIMAAFARARELAPCIVVLEDLDSLIDDTNRSFFLNEMDGFAANEGILVVATTNHPERLDPALIDRPSRFDRKITFHLPAETERRAFLALANTRREPSAQVSEAELDEIARLTDDFSFAYLKELGLSSLMAWMRNPVEGGMGEAMRSQIETLRAQMKTEMVDPKAEPRADEEDEDE